MNGGGEGNLEARRSGVFELYRIDLVTGLQRGKLLGLKWSDVDLDKGIIHVRRQVLRQNGEVVEAPLKTKNSYRNIAIGADAIKVLKGMEQSGISSGEDTYAHVTISMQKQAANAVGSFLSSTLQP